MLLVSASAIASFTTLSPAQAVTFDLSWKGQTLGYTADGQFSYDESRVPSDNIVRTGDLTSFDIAFFSPEGELLKSFEDNTQTPGFNFNFDTTTTEIFQTARWDSPEGINVGGVRGEELNLFSVGNPKADLFDTDAPSPHVHLTDWGDDFSAFPEGFTRGGRPHLDIAFFTRTRAEVLADPDAGNALGERLVATRVSESAQVPEPSMLLGLSAAVFVLSRLQNRRSVED